MYKQIKGEFGKESERDEHRGRRDRQIEVEKKTEMRITEGERE